MRSLLCACLAAVLPAAASASDTASGVVVVSATFTSRTSLRVSSEVLRFDVSAQGDAADVAVEFSAGARTVNGGEVVLSVEPVHGIQGPGGASDVETALSFDGQGAGTLSGHVVPSMPTVAARWVGSGLRSGRLVFSLRARADGTYSVPLRFVLSTP